MCSIAAQLLGLSFALFGHERHNHEHQRDGADKHRLHFVVGNLAFLLESLSDEVDGHQRECLKEIYASVRVHWAWGSRKEESAARPEREHAEYDQHKQDVSADHNAYRIEKNARKRPRFGPREVPLNDSAHLFVLNDLPLIRFAHSSPKYVSGR